MYLTKLKVLNMRNNNLDGEIPDFLGNMTNLEYINFNDNALDGEIPESLTNLSKLEYLNLNKNILLGEIPPSLSKLKNLKQLYLGNNFFSGEIPLELGELINLENLSLENNYLVGEIPIQLNQLNKLKTLSLNSNSFEGVISNSFFYLPQLEQLLVQDNWYTFETLEDKKYLIGSINFNYSTQAKVGQTLNVQVPYGSNYSLNVECGGLNNRYRWYFNNGAISANSASPNFELVNINHSNSGIYTCKITNPDATQLTIESYPITITVQAKAPADVVINGCGKDDIAPKYSLFEYRQIQQAITLADFRKEGGAIQTDCAGGDAAITITYQDVSNGGFKPEIITRTFRIMESCHTPYEITQKFTISDNTKPIIMCRDTVVVLDSTNQAKITAKQIGSGTYDLCDSNPIYSLDRTDFDDKNLGVNPVILTVTDASGNSVTCNSSVRIIAYNHPPSNITLSNQSIYENQPVGTEVGILEGIDADFGDIHTFKMVAGPGDDDNDLFEIIGKNTLVSKAVFDYETERLYTIRIETTDNGGKSYSKFISIDILNLNEDPTDILLSPQYVNENEPIGKLIGLLSTIDVDLNDNHTYSFISDASANDNDAFSIVGNQLLSNKIFDYEVKSDYVVRIKTEDLAGKAFVKSFPIKVIDANDAPTAILLSNQEINENEEVGFEIGELSTIDMDKDDTFTYSIISVDGDYNNNSFSISNNLLLSNEVFDYEAKDSYFVQIQSKDSGGDTISAVFLIDILNVNPENLKVLIPDAFSPNGDGINDLFRIRGIEKYPDANISIFNRWGSLVYEKEHYGDVDLHGEIDAWWDGRYHLKGQNNQTGLPAGTYFVVLQLDETNVFKGTVYLKK